jgi:hypothetical protein
MSLNNDLVPKEVDVLNENLPNSSSASDVTSHKTLNETNQNLEKTPQTNAEEGTKDGSEKKRRGRPPKNPTPAKISECVDEPDKGIRE